MNLICFESLLENFCIIAPDVVGMPGRVDKALLLVPSGIAHGPVFPMLKKMVVPFVSYYFHPSKKTLNAIISVMGGKEDEIWRQITDTDYCFRQRYILPGRQGF